MMGGGCDKGKELIGDLLCGVLAKEKQKLNEYADMDQHV